jgi:surface antigen
VTGDAKKWYGTAAHNGLPVGTTPVVGAVFVETDGLFGHVGVVTGIVNPTTFTTNEMNGGSVWTDYNTGKTNEFGHYFPHTRNTGPTMFFIYQPGTQPGAWIGHIVQWDADTKAQKTAWMVGPDGKRRWIPTIAIYGCLKSHGVPGPDPLPAATLDLYPDLTGQWETCSAAGFGAGAGAPPADPGQTTTTQTTTTQTTTTQQTTTAPQQPPPARVNAYDNYGSGAVGNAMCRGNPGNAASMPGGTTTETFTVPGGVASIDTALVQIDPDSTVTGYATLYVNGSARASTTATAAGDTTFSFSSVAVQPGDTITLSISFTATSGKIITVYNVGNPGGTFTTANSCPAGASNVTTSSSGLRAVISGWIP